MSDPLSITASIIALIQASYQVTVLVKQFRNEASAVDATLTGLLGDVEGFKRVLESMRETVDQSDIRSNLQSTGHTGSHWRNLARSLDDGADTLQKLHDLLDGINKKTSVLDAPRKLLRLKSASEQIAHYREQIQSSHTALQLSLSTIILWNQVTFQKSNERIPDKIVPTLDRLYDEFRTFGALLNAKIEKLQHAAADPSHLDNHQLRYMSNLRDCVRSAADVVSTASTTLNADSSDRVSVRYGSDFGDVFVRDANEPMLRWFASNTVYEYEDVEAPPALSETSTGDALTEYHSDTDSDLENDLIRSLFKEGKKRKEQGDLTGAVRHFRNCLARFSSNASYASLTATQSVSVCGVSKLELLEHLTDSYCLLGSWSKAKSTMAEKLVITERQVGRKDVLYLKDTMKLAELMMMNEDYVEAHLQARRSLRGFRKLGENGEIDYENCLAFLIQMCQAEGKEDEEEAYTALLAGHTRGVLRTVPEFRSSILTPETGQPQTLSAPDSQARPAEVIDIPEQTQKTLPELQESIQENISQTDLHAITPPSSQRLSGIQTDADEEHGKEGPDSHELETEPVYIEQDGKILAYNSRPSEKSPSKSEPTISAPIHSLDKTLETAGDDQDNNPEADISDVLETQLPAPGPAEDSERTELVGLSVEVEKPVSRIETVSSATHHLATAGFIPTPVNTLKRIEKEWCGSPSSLSYGTNYPVGVIEFMYKISEIAREEKVERRRREEREIADFLKTYCDMHGNEPRYSTSLGPWGYACTVWISDEQWCTASVYPRARQAIDAAAAKACAKYMSIDDIDMVMNLLERPDPFSDKEVYIPEFDDEYEVSTNDALLEYAPGITITQDGQDAAALHSVPKTVISDTRRSAERLSIRRYASDSSMPKEEAVSHGIMGRILAKSYAALRVRRTHQPAAANFPRIPLTSRESISSDSSSMQEHTTRPTMHATASDGDYPVSSRLDRCPICKDSFSELTQDALSHVNSCIASKYGLIDVPKRTNDEQSQGTETIVSSPPTSTTTSTFSEGLWSCDQCKPETLQYLSEDRCAFCFEPRYVSAPSSLNGFERDPSDCYQLVQTPPILLTPPSRNTIMRRKIVLLGDTLCGKTYLASTWSKGQLPSKPEESVMNNFIKILKIEGRQIELVIWDCNGMEEKEAVRRLLYSNVHMLLICFDISDPDSFANVEYMWKTEAEKYLPSVPKVLVGCKKDLRDDASTLHALRLREMLPISPYAGDNLAIKMHALAYFETSATDRQGLSELFEYVAKASLVTPPKPRSGGLRAALSKSENRLKP